MARKVTFNKESMLENMYIYISKYGIESMNARELCKFIGCSTQPLFKNFDNMDGVKKELKIYLHNYYDNFINEIIDTNDYLYTISLAYALFALKEPNIFKALFMTDLAGNRTIDEVLKSSWNLDTIKSITTQYNLSYEKSEKLYRDVRFFTHGLSCQIAINSILTNEEEIKNLIKNIIDKLK